MVGARDIGGIRLEVRGHEPPHEFTLTVEGVFREPVGDEVVSVMRWHGNEMAPDIARAIERVVMARLRGCERKHGENAAPQAGGAPARTEDVSDFEL